MHPALWECQHSLRLNGYTATNIKGHALGYNGGLFVCIGCCLVLLAEAMRPFGNLCVLAICVCWLFMCVGYLFALAVCVYWLFVCIGCLGVFAAAILWAGGQLAHGGGVAPAVLPTIYSTVRGSLLQHIMYGIT